MSKIYANQTELTIKLVTGKDITGSTCKIAYKDPSGTTGEWNASIDNALSGSIKYDIVTPLSIVGNWTIWAKITKSGLLSIGEPAIFIVYAEGN